MFWFLLIFYGLLLTKLETRKTTLKMDGQHKRKCGIWHGKIKRDNKRQKQMAQSGGGKDRNRERTNIKR
jgi:hypothetical protein